MRVGPRQRRMGKRTRVDRHSDDRTAPFHPATIGIKCPTRLFLGPLRLLKLCVVADEAAQAHVKPRAVWQQLVSLLDTASHQQDPGRVHLMSPGAALDLAAIVVHVLDSSGHDTVHYTADWVRVLLRLVDQPHLSALDTWSLASMATGAGAVDAGDAGDAGDAAPAGAAATIAAVARVVHWPLRLGGGAPGRGRGPGEADLTGDVPDCAVDEATVRQYLTALHQADAVGALVRACACNLARRLRACRLPLRVRVPSLSTTPQWGSIRSRPPIRTYAPWGVRVDEQAKSRQMPTRNNLPLFLASRCWPHSPSTAPRSASRQVHYLATRRPVPRKAPSLPPSLLPSLPLLHPARPVRRLSKWRAFVSAWLAALWHGLHAKLLCSLAATASVNPAPAGMLKVNATVRLPGRRLPRRHRRRRRRRGPVCRHSRPGRRRGGR